MSGKTIPVRPNIEIIALLSFAIMALTPGRGLAEAFGEAAYDAKSDELIVTMLYSGTNPDHQFSLQVPAAP